VPDLRIELETGLAKRCSGGDDTPDEVFDVFATLHQVLGDVPEEFDCFVVTERGVGNRRIGIVGVQLASHTFSVGTSAATGRAGCVVVA